MPKSSTLFRSSFLHADSIKVSLWLPTVVRELLCTKDGESFAGGSAATGRASYAHYLQILSYTIKFMADGCRIEAVIFLFSSFYYNKVFQ